MDPVEDDENAHDVHVSMRVAVENDETEGLPTSLRTLGSFNSSTELQISSSIPSTYPRIESLSSDTELQISSSIPDFQWSQEVLTAFDALPDFTSEQAKDLASMLNALNAIHPSRVTDYMIVFQHQQDHYRGLRKLTQQLKSLNRADVVRAMHQQRGELRWLGPLLPEDTPIRDMAPSLWVPLTAALSHPHRSGYDWKWLAKKVEIPPQYINLWEHEKNPAGEVLRSWQVRNDATVGRLFDILIEHREDLAALL
ncbi:uncharacterized protein [Hyperolius riggenbachi]|uniref:uncharacterized protein n=1 Tax=Hyperolius riggenbachi TaxID=752182 RepID=UPI0035A31858